MSAIAVIGEAERVRCFAFAGVYVAAADDSISVRNAWDALPADVGLVILTRAARDELTDLDERDPRLWVVMPA
jgi:vacuolar-type H+-ATPase subunit F/Vma7